MKINRESSTSFFFSYRHLPPATTRLLQIANVKFRIFKINKTRIRNSSRSRLISGISHVLFYSHNFIRTLKTLLRSENRYRIVFLSILKSVTFLITNHALLLKINTAKNIFKGQCARELQPTGFTQIYANKEIKTNKVLISNQNKRSKNQHKHSSSNRTLKTHNFF